jgi:hypothetical protein
LVVPKLRGPIEQPANGHAETKANKIARLRIRPISQKVRPQTNQYWTPRAPSRAEAGWTRIEGKKCPNRLERVKGIEPSYSAWKAAALPLSYTRARPINYHARRAASTSDPHEKPGQGYA